MFFLKSEQFCSFFQKFQNINSNYRGFFIIFFNLLQDVHYTPHKVITDAVINMLNFLKSTGTDTYVEISIKINNFV